MRASSIDKPFLISVVVLSLSGFLIFTSASMGLFARGSVSFSDVAFNQGILGLIGGFVALFITSRIFYRNWRKYSFYVFAISLILTFAVFIPGLGLAHGGARRWLLIGSFSFQSSELLKLGFIIYLAAWLSGVKQKVSAVLYGLLPFLILLAVVGFSLLIQPDTDTFFIIFIAGVSMLLASGAKFRHVALLGLIAGLAFTVVAFSRPYIMDRVLTFFDSSRDPLGTSYQIQQSFIAIGSGGIFGRGFGQSIQKFDFLPEPIGDSVFAVAAEEFGFVGSVSLILLFLYFAYRGVKIAIRAPDLFGGLLTLGLVILIVAQSFLNIGAMLGILPLTGIPLLFVSHGGTALFITLAEIGIILNVSKYQKRTL